MALLRTFENNTTLIEPTVIMSPLITLMSLAMMLGYI